MNLIRPSQSIGVIIRGQDSCDKVIIRAPEKRGSRMRQVARGARVSKIGIVAMVENS
jgi:hypothetical protein